MLIELHLIQSFAPSNLNRDDTGSPKDCEFGGARRARISSQAIKRAMRTEFDRAGLVPPHLRAVRTKRLIDTLAGRLIAEGRSEEQARAAAREAVNATGVKIEEDSQTAYLFFIGAEEIERVAALCREHWDALVSAPAEPAPIEGETAAPARGRRGRPATTSASQLAGPVKTTIQRSLDGGRAVDLGLFGRMLADLPERNIDAASQVAHAISTHEVSVEFDFYTAVDDLRPEDTSGAGMLGTVEYNAACFYRYANVDVGQLRRNLGGDDTLVAGAVEAFVRASWGAIPTGKQNGFAAQNPPSFMLAVARDAGLWSLTNAFLKPVRATGEHDLVHASVAALDDYWGKLLDLYGDDAHLRGTWVCALDSSGLGRLAGARRPTLGATVADVRSTVESWLGQQPFGAGR
jgi:CRISPR system Cascade subunit CasC